MNSRTSGLLFDEASSNHIPILETMEPVTLHQSMTLDALGHGRTFKAATSPALLPAPPRAAPI
jgi:hypothetical protein